jgi:hypothetical protein
VTRSIRALLFSGSIIGRSCTPAGQMRAQHGQQRVLVALRTRAAKQALQAGFGARIQRRADRGRGFSGRRP